MKTATVSNTLAGFKHMVESAKSNGIYIQTTIRNGEGIITRQNQFTPITIAQSNSFALQRPNGDSWIEYGKASSWQFDLPNNKATKLMLQGCSMTIKFSDISFFGF